MKKFRTTLWVSVLLIVSNAPGVEGQEQKHGIRIVKNDKRIWITGTPPGGPASIEIRITSTRNRSISSYQEVSPHDPDFEELNRARQDATWDIFYPVVDVVPTGTMKGVAAFSEPLHTFYSVNGMFKQALFIMKGTGLTIENEYLLNWENNIYIDAQGAQMTSFALVDEIQVNDALDLSYDLLSPSWSGEVAIYAVPDGKELARVSLEDRFENPLQGSLSRFAGEGLKRERLMASLEATLKYTLGSQDGSAHSDTREGLYIFYDKASGTYRRSTWVWAWGPSIKLMLESAEMPEIQKVIPRDQLIRAALEIGETSLKFQNMDPASPAYGIIVSRWSENKGTLLENYGFEEYYSIADAQFLAGWGWMPLFRATGDERYLDGVKLLTETTGRLTGEFDIIPMDYMVRARRWKDYALNEQGFGTEGINELYQTEPDDTYRKIGDEYMKMILRKFDTESGLWNRSYWIDRDERVPTAYHTRGAGWAMEGLLAAYELTQDPLYLEKAERMAGYMTDTQLPDGSWSYDFNSRNEGEISEKGTALWSLLYYKLYGFTGKEEHLSVARKALTWCLDNQYDGPDLHAHGGVVGISRQSGVIYRKWFPLTCSYTSGFFGLALLEELSIQKGKREQP